MNHVGGWIVRGHAQWITERALLIDLGSGGGQRWIPLSQIRDVLEGTIDAAHVNRVHRASDEWDHHATPYAHHGHGLTMGDDSGLGVVNHYDCPVVLSVNPWWVNRDGLPHEKPSRARRKGGAA